MVNNNFLIIFFLVESDSQFLYIILIHIYIARPTTLATNEKCSRLAPAWRCGLDLETNWCPMPVLNTIQTFKCKL